MYRKVVVEPLDEVDADVEVATEASPGEGLEEAAAAEASQVEEEAVRSSHRQACGHGGGGQSAIQKRSPDVKES